MEEMPYFVRSARALLRGLPRGGYLVKAADSDHLSRTRRAVGRLCRLLLNNPIDLEVVRSRSYRHENGFDKIVLHQSRGSVSEIRMHLWHPGVRSSDDTSSVHDHSADFASMVLCGHAVANLYVAEKRPKHNGGQFDLYCFALRAS